MPVTFPMMVGSPFTLSDASGNRFELPWISAPGAGTPKAALTMDRPVGGTTPFYVGDGLPMPEMLILAGALIGAGPEPVTDVIQKVQALESALKTCARLTWTPGSRSYYLTLAVSASFQVSAPFSGRPSAAFIRSVTVFLAPGGDGRVWRDAETGLLAGTLL